MPIRHMGDDVTNEVRHHHLQMQSLERLDVLLQNLGVHISLEHDWKESAV